MNGQEFGSYRRLDATEITLTQGLSSPAYWPSSRAHLAAQEVKNTWSSQSKSISLGALRISQAESLPLFQKPKREHHPLRASSAAECWDPAPEVFSSSLITGTLQSVFAKRLELGTRRDSLTNPKEAWTEKNLEATAPLETQGKGRMLAFPRQVTNQGENPPTPQGEGHKDLWKDIIMKYGIASPRRGLQMVSQHPKRTDNFEGHVLEGRKIHLKLRSQVQEMKDICSWEESQEEEVQMPKKEKAKDKRAKEREAQYQFSREKAFLQRKLMELGLVPVEGTSLLDKKKTQALGMSTRDYYLSSGPREYRGKPLAQDDNNKEATRKQSKKEKRRRRMQWWDPIVWGDPVILVNREQASRKTCSEFPSDLRKPNFPIGSLGYKNTTFVL